MVPTDMLISTFLKEIYSPLQSINQKSTSNVIIISQSRCATLRQLYNLIHHELVYNLSLLLSFGIWFSVELKQSLIIAHLTKSWRLDVTGRQWRRLVLSAVKLNQIFHTVNMKKAHNNDQKGINPPPTPTPPSHTHMFAFLALLLKDAIFGYWPLLSWRLGHENISTAILHLPLI